MTGDLRRFSLLFVYCILHRNFEENLTLIHFFLPMFQLRDAAACLILANRHATNPDEEDGANIMRAAALKNNHARVRIIIQLLQSHNKVTQGMAFF